MADAEMILGVNCEWDLNSSPANTAISFGVQRSPASIDRRASAR